MKSFKGSLVGIWLIPVFFVTFSMLGIQLTDSWRYIGCFSPCHPPPYLFAIFIGSLILSILLGFILFFISRRRISQRVEASSKTQLFSGIIELVLAIALYFLFRPSGIGLTLIILIILLIDGIRKIIRSRKLEPVSKTPFDTTPRL